MSELIRIVRNSTLTRAECTCGEIRQSARDSDVIQWGNRHDSAGGSPDNHRVSLTQWAIPVDVETE